MAQNGQNAKAKAFPKTVGFTTGEFDPKPTLEALRQRWKVFDKERAGDRLSHAVVRGALAGLALRGGLHAATFVLGLAMRKRRSKAASGSTALTDKRCACVSCWQSRGRSWCTAGYGLPLPASVSPCCPPHTAQPPQKPLADPAGLGCWTWCAIQCAGGFSWAVSAGCTCSQTRRFRCWVAKSGEGCGKGISLYNPQWC
jgi:hypothetical protein